MRVNNATTKAFNVQLPSFDDKTASGNSIFAPTSSKILGIRCKPGDQMNVGDSLIIFENFNITARKQGKIKSILCQEGEVVTEKQHLIEFDEDIPAKDQ